MDFTNTEKKDLAVVALGGNAIIKKGDRGNINAQFENTRRSMKAVLELIRKDIRLVLTHGNGPQVGNIMLMVDKARDVLPETPLGVADAMTCGSMGYMIEQCLQNIMIKNNIWKNVVTIPAQILVDKNDPSLKYPTKPIGPFYSQEEAEELKTEKDWVIMEDSGRGYRRYVPSPYPLEIIEKDAIKLLLDQDYIVVTGGGGGIPVYYDEDHTIEGLDCVIDKDLASMKIALAVGAELLIIVTGVPRVSLNFGKPDQQDLERMTLAEAKYYNKKGHFAAGSMGPKIEAAIEFVQASPQNRVIITDVENLPYAVEGKAGTTIVPY